MTVGSCQNPLNMRSGSIKLCLSAVAAWTNYVVNVSNIVIWPDYPRFPGPIFFNVTMDVSEELPTERVEMDLEVALNNYNFAKLAEQLNRTSFAMRMRRALTSEFQVRHAVTNKQGSKGWQVIPCQGWNILDGCDGVGSCRYCDMLEKCREAVKSADKYVTDRKAQDFLRQNKLCPPPKGHWTMTFSKVFTTEDLPKSFFGPLQSNEYWLTFSFTDGKDKKLGCARLWVDVCKYHLQARSVMTKHCEIGD
ncbi:unnamed protein product [Toxocara canis]|uniref:ML domain-containing protein n=1 Tax=Toxocara canis TaxID=6265 RepID=A0A183VFB5_TOXCA|nr:unnamed protein product [Toxocara canis]